MKRTDPQYESLDHWWSNYRAELADGPLPLCLDAWLACPDEQAKGLLAQVLALLHALGADQETLAAACLHHWLIAEQAIGEPFLELPEQVRQLADELSEIDRLEAAYHPDRSQADAEGLRRLLLALVRDVRVVLIALCDRLVRLRGMSAATEEEQGAYARRVQAIHAPLANRLGIWQLKWELEDLVFRYLHPDTYRRIARLLDERRVDRERYIRRLVEEMTTALREAGIEAQVLGRPKHIFSIWRKMQRKSLAFHELFDVRAVRVLVGSVTDCYAALGLVHARWRPIPGEFDDYIANPKSNHYRSLHTAIYGPEGKAVEVQIRTHEMHEHAELGVAAHWRYKEGGQHDPGYQRKLNWMRQLLEAHDEEADEALLDEFGGEGSDERVYVLTPRGQVVDLRGGSTVLDFAYHIHTDVGHRCRGAKVNGRIVPLTYQPKNGQQVEILTGKEPEPSRDWLVPRLGYLKGSRARAKVRQWFKHKDYERNLADGRELLDKELKRLAAGTSDLEPVLERLHLKSLEALYVAIATGEVTCAQVASAVEEHRRPEDEDVVPLARTSSPTKKSSDDLVIEGVGNLMTTLARCCSPVPGDPISGYVTRGRGVSIHRADCPNALRLLAASPERELEVEWGGQTRDLYQAELLVSAYDRKGLIRDLGNTLQSCRSDVLSINTQTDSSQSRMEIRLAVRVGDFEHLSLILNRLSSIPNVYDAKRVG